MFKGEIISQLNVWWTALTPGRLVFGGGVLWICVLVVWRLLILPTQRKIDQLAKQQADYTMNFNREQHAHIEAVQKEQRRLDALEKRVAALDGIKE